MSLKLKKVLNLTLRLGFRIHEGALFLFLHFKVRFVITKTLLATVHLCFLCKLSTLHKFA
ncbi:hypothetical protein OSCI_1820010 [Kamptonema sp. PCC 6506]|nr:hypothetical protein OSCI_1820010 [Kamptonema sp. PCC 6506]